MGEWSKYSKTHVSSMKTGDFFGSEKSITVSKEKSVSIIFEDKKYSSIKEAQQEAERIKKEKDAAKQRYYERIRENGINPDIRCCARIWSYPPFVFYDRENKKWILGEQCSRKQKKDDLCGIHLRYLPHGKMNEKPPHDKFQKYQKRVAAKN